MAVGFAVAALYHGTALAVPSFAKAAYPADYPLWRHVVFIVVDGAGAYLFLKRPVWLIWPYLLLTVQVLQGHGVRLVRTWTQMHQIQWVDVITVAGILLGLGLLLMDRPMRGGAAKR
jgi:hypothetical protein